ncbi:hypothetical protein [Metapseudomonas resinovorans]|uniref:Uncharacterized protein n=1 Tax=Metapseudomonas resinovorans NBRC 106553 TaxID=1245471 RepID=S6AW51_METRE|nr:hypothetical protein [Pseudomonas resinovorans]BAN48766.1 hypothetical protein PCA10_30340 [Pseudomonas resinovorans NBRC 106553]
MNNPFLWAELRRLSLNVSAAHIAMVAFLERAMVPWSADQVLEFQRICAVELAAIDEYQRFFEHRCGSHSTPVKKLPRPNDRRA